MTRLPDCAMMDLNPFNWNIFVSRKLRATSTVENSLSGCTILTSHLSMKPEKHNVSPSGFFFFNTLLWSLFYARESLQLEGAGSYSWTDKGLPSAAP